MVDRVKNALADINDPITVAVMGCVVNGPGEAADADVALCGGKNTAAIYLRGKLLTTVPAAQAVDTLNQQVRLFLDQK